MANRCHNDQLTDGLQELLEWLFVTKKLGLDFILKVLPLPRREVVHLLILSAAIFYYSDRVSRGIINKVLISSRFCPLFVHFSSEFQFQFSSIFLSASVSWSIHYYKYTIYNIIQHTYFSYVLLVSRFPKFCNNGLNEMR